MEALNKVQHAAAERGEGAQRERALLDRELVPIAEHAPFDPVDRAQAQAIGSLGLLDAQGDVRPLEEIENEVLRFAITHYRGQMSEVARRLRIGRSTLYRKLDEIGIGAGDQRSGGENVASG